MKQKVILVNRDDKVIGEMEKIEAHQKALLHRAVSVFIFDTKGHMLLQKRAMCKYHSPGLWTNTACTHPQPNESYEKAATRRLSEEMGITNTALTKLFDFVYKEELDQGLTEHELDHVFIGISDAAPKVEPTEVSDYRYVAPKELLTHIQASPQAYTVWFKQIINQVIEEFSTLQKKR